MKTQKNKTIVYFHTGRGGRFYNSGHQEFRGTKTIGEVLALCDSSSQWAFLHNRDKKGRFIAPIYLDQNGSYLISEKEVSSGVGQLDWDGAYDTDTCIYLSDCGETDLNLILESNEYNKKDLIVEYFDECTDLIIDWARFNGNYEGLISNFFYSSDVDVDYFYE